MAEAGDVTGRPAAPDQGARDRIGAALDETLFVEAGAGSGKTTALVGRVLSLVTGEGADGRAHPPVPLSGIAAITFTEKAGAELRERLRRNLEEAATADPGHPRAALCRAALDELDGAAIGTLHSFAQRILVEHPVEAGLPPRVEVLDEVTSGVEFEQRWARFSDELYADPAYARTFLLLFAAGVRDTTPHALARTFDSNWDLVDEMVDPDAPEPRPAGPRIAGVLDRVEAIADLVGECIDPTDLLCLKLQEVGEWAATVRAAPDEEAQVEALRQARAATSTFRPRGGRKGSWRVSSDVVKADLRGLEELVDEVLRQIADECAHHLGAAIRRFTLTSAAERRSRGTLEFHDLLVLARSLLRDPTHGARTRQALHDRYQRLLLDEFQDTDPIQIELAVRIAAADPTAAGAAALDWRDVPVAPGRLFVVGDPKQSIYRFRRADIGVFLDAQRLLAGSGDAPSGEGGQAVTLTANFRTVPGVTDWVNTTFAALMAEPPDDELPFTPRPDYVALDAVRTDPSADAGPTVAVLGRHAHTGRPSASEVRRAEAADVVATIRRAQDEHWQVGATTPDGAAGWRDAALGDITILVPARTSLPFLEEALSDAGIAYRTEASSLVYASRAVRDLLLVVRAVADPTDELRTVSALRTPLFGCGDDDLYRFKVERGGHWAYTSGDPGTAGQPDTVPADDPVRAGLTVLRGWHDERAWTSPSALLDRIVRDRRALELAFAEGRPRDVWRRLRFVIDQARAWTDATGGDLRGYLGWIGHQTEEGARVAEAILPETDDDAVRIMTIHAAKGLEFPITIVSGATSYPRRAATAGDAKFTPQGVAYYLGKHAETSTYTANRPVDEQMDLDERIRLLYVATTRAKDHLVVSLHRIERKKEPAPANRTNAELLVAGMGDLLEVLPDGPPDEAPLLAAEPAAPAAATPLGPLPAWEAARDTALAAASRPTTVAATALTDEGRPDADRPDPVSPAPERDEDRPETGQLALDFATVRVDHELDRAPDGDDAGLHKRPGDLDRPPWLKGRYGTAVGRAVHGVLQTVPLAVAPDDPLVGAAVAAQAAAEAVSDREPVVAQLVAAALGSPSVRQAAAAPHWREVYASTPVGERILEGYVDLLYRGPDGLVVVDYKTAATAEPAELDRRVAGYRIQGASYALAVGGSTGEEVVRVTFCFLTPQGVVERHLDDLAAAVAEVEALVRAGAEVEVDRPVLTPAP